MPLHIVLGGGGFLGRHLAMALGRAGNRVIAVDRAFHGAAPAGVEQREADLLALSQEELCELISGADVVQHLVWSSVPATANLMPERDAGENLGFMIRILSAVRSAQTRLVFASSGGTVYGSADVETLAEDHLLCPISIYGATKVSAEIYATVFRATYGVDVRIARLSNPFGIGQATSLLQGSVSRFVTKAVAGEVIEIWGDGEVVRDFIHVQDAVAGLVRLGACRQDVLGDGIFNIGSGTGTSLNKVIAILSDLLERPVETRYQPARSFDVRRNVLNIDRAAARLGWKPQLTLRQGVERMIIALRDGCSSIYSEIDVPEALFGHNPAYDQAT